jgi:hypothetical protein
MNPTSVYVGLITAALPSARDERFFSTQTQCTHKIIGDFSLGRVRLTDIAWASYMERDCAIPGMIMSGDCCCDLDAASSSFTSVFVLNEVTVVQGATRQRTPAIVICVTTGVRALVSVRVDVRAMTAVIQKTAPRIGKSCRVMALNSSIQYCCMVDPGMCSSTNQTIAARLPHHRVSEESEKVCVMRVERIE